MLDTLTRTAMQAAAQMASGSVRLIALLCVLGCVGAVPVVVPPSSINEFAQAGSVYAGAENPSPQVCTQKRCCYCGCTYLGILPGLPGTLMTATSG
jgi:hypothetical protein